MESVNLEIPFTVLSTKINNLATHAGFSSMASNLGIRMQSPSLKPV